ncbi:unnamed protein product, partial [marine sediment metagenome]
MTAPGAILAAGLTSAGIHSNELKCLTGGTNEYIPGTIIRKIINRENRATLSA